MCSGLSAKFRGGKKCKLEFLMTFLEQEIFVLTFVKVFEQNEVGVATVQ